MQFTTAFCLAFCLQPASVPDRVEIIAGANAPIKTQQLAVIAHFQGGSSRDVTRLAVFSSSDESTATVNDKGLVLFHQSGEVTILCRYLTTTQVVRLAYAESKPDFRWPNPPEVNFVDKHVFAKLKRFQIAPAELCSDVQFLRRAYLDACAILPTPEEARKFLADKDKDKRAKLIDRLLERPEFADAWTYHWADALVLNPAKLGQKNARVYQAWIRTHVAANTPADRMVRELLTSQGHSERQGGVNFFRGHDGPAKLAEHTASVFLGVRLQCAGCHADFTAPWTPDDYHGLTAFFTQVTRKRTGKLGDSEIISLAPKSAWLHPQTRKIVPAKFLGGAQVRFKADEDHRGVFADWLTAADNPFFAKVIVNRVWSNLFHRGIVEPVDDFRFTNPPVNDALLDALAADFVAHGYDHKRLIRTIMNSRTYQLSPKVQRETDVAQKFFAHRTPTWLFPEQMSDAIAQFMEVQEPIQGWPAGTRAVQALDTIEPHFLSIGPPPPPPHWEYVPAPRWYKPHVMTIVHERNLRKAFDTPKNRITRLLASKLSDREMAEDLFLAALSRLPREKDLDAVLKHVAREGDRRRHWEDVAWALMNTFEFTRRP